MSLARSVYQGWSLCPDSQSVQCLICLGHHCQSIWTGQVFGLCILPALHHKTDKGHTDSSQSQGCSPGVHFVGRLDFCRPRTFLAWLFCKKRHPQRLRRRSWTLILLNICVHSHPRDSTHGKMLPGSLKKVPPFSDTSLGQRASPLSL